MIKILFGTGNAGKLAVVRRGLQELPIKILSIGDVPDLIKSIRDSKYNKGVGCGEKDLPYEGALKLPEVEETGKTPLENAKIKALAYYEQLGVPVFSCDSGLVLEGLPQELQPGVHVRNINNKRLTDEEMTAYYGSLAAEYGDITARYQNGVCLILDKTHIYESMDEDLSGEKFLLTSKPYPKRQQGFPLDCLSKDIKTGKYYYEMEGIRQDDLALDKGFYRFFEHALKDADLL